MRDVDIIFDVIFRECIKPRKVSIARNYGVFLWDQVTHLVTSKRKEFKLIICAITSTFQATRHQRYSQTDGQYRNTALWSDHILVNRPR